jgi:site-specific DNA-methyltransferase (adenine-specific)
MEKIKLINDDCMKVMSQYDDNYFDLAIVDPPFGIGNFVQTGGNKRGDEVKWNDNTPSKEYFNELKRVSKNRIIFGANYYNCFEEKGGAIVWIKNQPMPNFSKCVIASCSYHKKIEMVERTWTNFVNDRQTNHPCEMPVNLYYWIYKNYCKKDFKILDTHLGSGSNAVASHQFGVSEFVGIEIDKKYFKEAQKRIKKQTKQIKLF